MAPAAPHSFYLDRGMPLLDDEEKDHSPVRDVPGASSTGDTSGPHYMATLLGVRLYPLSLAVRHAHMNHLVGIVRRRRQWRRQQR